MEIKRINMKAKCAERAFKLEDIPNIGKALAEDFRHIGIERPSQLKGKEGMAPGKEKKVLALRVLKYRGFPDV